MLSNAYLLAKIGADTAENEQHFAENLPIGRRVADVDVSAASACCASPPRRCCEFDHHVSKAIFNFFARGHSVKARVKQTKQTNVMLV